jgi:hypothetical protein
MDYQGLAVHRTIVAVDVEGFGNRHRTNRIQVAVREGLYRAMQEAFRRTGIPWIARDHEDRGDGMFILVGSEVPKSLFVESLPSALAAALHMHNSAHPDLEKIRLRMALHAGEVNYDEHGVTGASINLTFRLLESAPVKEALAGSPGVLAVITSPWFFEEVVQHSTADASAYHPVPVAVKETTTTGWICLPDHPGQFPHIGPGRPSASTETTTLPVGAQHVGKVRLALSLAYRSALAESITPAGDMPVGLEIPTLGEGYVDHQIRVSEVTSSSEPSRESWWAEVPVTDNACRFLISRMTSPAMLSAPVILLGQPGSGKSVLARILAARLSLAGLLAVRVELRQVPAEADLQDQIEAAIRGATGERVQWSQFVESGYRAMPVVIFDGFDELLQATGAAHDDFLLRVQAFQEREARLGRPLAVIVTSRVILTDRARIPYGAMIIRLEPFYREQIAEWLAIWAKTNLISLARRGMKPLPADVALKYEELAQQPLLLLMLALYDADANALQHRSAILSRTELYGRLLSDFARREIRKHSPAIPETDLERAVEAELMRLSVVAFAMFNRRSQWVPEADLNADFSALSIDGGAYTPQPDKSLPRLSAAQLIVGRFFFIRESRATYNERQFRTYEFLHATFGEFLVARLVVRVLTATLIPEAAVSASLPQNMGDGGMLHALLSFSALTSRMPVVVFVGDLLAQLDVQRRTAIADLLLQLHGRALFSYPELVYGGYEPLELTVTTRHAAWSANLVVLAVLAAGKITGTQLFPREPDPGWAWRKEAMIWRSQLCGYGWESLYQAIALNHVWDGQRRDILLWRNDGTFIPEAPDIFWTHDIPPGAEARKGIFAEQGQQSTVIQYRTNFAAGMSENTMAHGLAPLTSSFPAVANVFVVLDNEYAVSATHALLAALYAPYQDDVPDDSVYLNLARVACKITQDPNVERDTSYLKAALGILISRVEEGVAPPSSLVPFAGLVRDAITEDTRLARLLARLDGLLSDHGLSGNARVRDKA